MTPPIPPVTPPESATVRIVEMIGTSLSRLIVGLMLFGPGVYWFIDEIRTARLPGDAIHPMHISAAAALMVAGGVSINPPFSKQITAIFVSVAPYIPWVGGKRAGDPPASPPTPPTA